MPTGNQMIAPGPIQEITTTRHDYVAKTTPKRYKIIPEGHIRSASAPFEKQTVNKLSYGSPDMAHFTPAKSCKPIRHYTRSEGWYQYFSCRSEELNHILIHLQFQWIRKRRPNWVTLQFARHLKRIIHGPNGPAISPHAYRWRTTRRTRRVTWLAVAQSVLKWFRPSITYMYLLIPGLNQRQSTKKVTIALVANDRQRSALWNSCGYRIKSWKMTPFTRYCLAMWWIIPNSFDRTKPKPADQSLLHFPHTLNTFMHYMEGNLVWLMHDFDLWTENVRRTTNLYIQYHLEIVS